MEKRLFDIFTSLILLLLSAWMIGIFILVLTILSGQTGLFKQLRVGRYGAMFIIYKLRTIYANPSKALKALSKFLRRSKIDELPQLYNVLIGDMSMVGPRPDVSGYYDLLMGKQRLLLQLRPGMTGPATLKYANEEALLLQQFNREKYNAEIIFPDKVRINLEYLKRQNLLLDIKILLFTVLGKKLDNSFYNG